ncbi:MAG: glycosyltransferase [Bacteroidia bacterium]
MPISIILPCYNPLKNWHIHVAANISRLKEKLNQQDIEVIVVNDGSTNNNITHVEIDFLKQQLPNFKYLNNAVNKGKGYTLRAGVNVANGDIIIYTDIDFPYTDESFLQILNSLDENQLAIGVRGDSYYRKVGIARLIISKLLKWLIKLFFKIPTNDTQGGLKGFTSQVKPIFLSTAINRYLFDLEFVYLCSRKNIKTSLVPVTLRPNLKMSRMNWKILLSESVNLFKILIKA